MFQGMFHKFGNDCVGTMKIRSSKYANDERETGREGQQIM